MAKQTASDLATLPRHMGNLIDETARELTTLQGLLNEHTKKIRDLVNAEFEAKGGCKACLGRGWVVVWDTMDCMDGSYAEYARCPEENCTDETRRLSGLYAPEHQSKYDRNKSVSDPVVGHVMYKIVCHPLLKLVNSLSRELLTLRDNRKAKKGERVVVVKGRKAPLGTTGVVAFVATNGSYLIKHPERWQDRNEQGTWVNCDNCEKVVL